MIVSGEWSHNREDAEQTHSGNSVFGKVIETTKYHTFTHLNLIRRFLKPLNQYPTQSYLKPKNIDYNYLYTKFL